MSKDPWTVTLVSHLTGTLDGLLLIFGYISHLIFILLTYEVLQQKLYESYGHVWVSGKLRASKNLTRVVS